MEAKMKPIKAFTLGISVTVLLALVVVSAFWVGKASATTGCFADTNGHWAESFICWMKDNGISAGIGGGNYGPEEYVTRAQMAVFMQKQAEIPPSTGQIIINGGPDKWQVQGNPDPAITRYTSDISTTFTRSSVGNTLFFAVFETPTILYGRQLSATGMEYCNTASASAQIVNVEGWLVTQTGGATGSSNLLFNDSTLRTNAACLYYAFATPRSLNDNHILSIYVSGNWTAPGQLKLGRITLFLSPTTTQLTGPSLLQPAEGVEQSIQEDWEAPINP
jgi:hypothetical protein